MEPLELSVNPSRKDFSRVVRRTILRQPFVMAVVLISTFVALIWGSGAANIAREAPELVGIYYICMAAFIFTPISLLFIMPLTLGANAKKKHDKEAPVTWVLNDEHLQINTAQTKLELKWSNFSSIIETATDYHFISTGRQATLFFPKTGFESSEQEKQFRHIVEARIGTIKQKGIKKSSAQGI